jgi:type III secretion protein V
MSPRFDSPMHSGPAGLARYSDFALAGLVMLVVAMFVLPMPPWALDMLVALNIALGVVLLLTALFVPSPLSFSTFPAVLVIATLLRMALNVATTRQILLTAHAGDIIDAFGRLVIGGNLIVGLVVFFIITVIQFIVIAKGAERVAEVGARFTLDALPGKQMSIDADLRAGLISQTEAVTRRQTLIQESQFYGAMDGAMKWVKGDSIASIIAVLVNLLGGVAIGVLMKDMSAGAAVQKFSILTIGDGLVSQLPSLFTSIAAGIAVTRTAPDGSAHLADQITRQIAAHPRALMLGALVLFLFAWVPGMPTLVFVALAGGLALAARLLVRREQVQRHAQRAGQIAAASREGEAAPMQVLQSRAGLRAPSAFRLEIAPALLDAITLEALDAALQRERERLREHFGIPFPGLVLQAAPRLAPRACEVLVQDLADSCLDVPEGAVLVLGKVPQQAQGVAGETPTWLGPAQWVREVSVKGTEAQLLTPAALIATAVVQAIQKNAQAALGVQEVRQLIREHEGRFPDLVREALAVLPLPRLADLMAALARERVPLVDFAGLLQALVTQAPGAADLNGLYEGVRQAMARGIVARALPAGAQALPVVTIDTAFEASLRAALTIRPDGPVLALPPDSAQGILGALQNALARNTDVPVLLLPGDLRRAASRLLRAGLPRVAFLSHEELEASGMRAHAVTTASLPAAA